MIERLLQWIYALLRTSTPKYKKPIERSLDDAEIDVTREVFINACLTFLGLPYKWGGDDTIQGYDCSGLVQELLAMIGLDPSGDQTAQALYNHFKDRSKEGPRDLGTLVFYGSSVSRISHIGLMIDEHTMIEAGGGGSRTNTPQDAASQNAYIRLRPFNRRGDIVAILNPKGLPWA